MNKEFKKFKHKKNVKVIFLDGKSPIKFCCKSGIHNDSFQCTNAPVGHANLRT